MPQKAYGTHSAREQGVFIQENDIKVDKEYCQFYNKSDINDMNI